MFGKNTGKVPRPTTSPEHGHTFCASLRGQNVCQDFTGATLCGNLQEKCCAPSGAQNAHTHFVRACAVETHVKISQEPLYLHGNLQETCRAPAPRPRLCASLCSESKRMSKFHTSHCIQQFSAQKERRTWTDILREPAHVKTSQEPLSNHSLRKFIRKVPRPSLSPECGHTHTHLLTHTLSLCASLRSQNACQDFTRANLYGNLQV